MTIQEVVTTPHPILRRKAKKMFDFDQDLQILINDMVETMREAPGVGLAANQIGILKRIIVVEYGADDDEDGENAPKKLYIVINPEITHTSLEMVIGVEACLSVPGLCGDVERFGQIVIKGLNRYGKPEKIKAEGWLARIFQHEIDHLEGVLFTDRACRIWQPAEDEQLPEDV
jgi:peptide deformylase